VADEHTITPEQIAEQLRKLKVSDLLVAETSTLAQIAYAKLGEGDLEQARLAIDALTALRPLVPGDAAVEVDNVLASLKLAYVDAAKES
jgi:hypothetical protein